MSKKLKMPTKAIICAAGLGTRFLPQTKSMPKEMLPVIDRPVIQLVVENLVAAGVTEIIIVTGLTKRSIEDHFDRNYELERQLVESGKQDKMESIRDISEIANFVYVRQKGEPKGNARPVINAAHLINDEPFFVFFADDFFRTEGATHAQQLLEIYKETGKSVIPLVEINIEDSDKYGMAQIGDKIEPFSSTFEITELREKPGKEHTNSNLASVGGYLLTPDILPIIKQEKLFGGNEITLADSINQLAQQDKVYGKVIDGTWHDAGDQFKYIQAVIDMVLHDDRYAKDMEKHLRQVVNNFDQSKK